MSYQYPSQYYPNYGGESSSAGAAGGNGSWGNVVGVPSSGTGHPTTYPPAATIPHQNPSAQRGALPSLVGAGGQPSSTAAHPGYGYGIGSQDPYPEGTRMPNEGQNYGGGRSSARHRDTRMEYVEGAPIVSYESYIGTQPHPQIAHRQVEGGHYMQNPPGQNQSHKPPSAFMQKEFKTTWTKEICAEVVRLRNKYPHDTWEDTGNRIGRSGHSCRKAAYKHIAEAKARAQAEQGGQ